MNFVTTQNKINKMELYNQMEGFYRRTKLKAHFWDTHKQANLSDKKYAFKSKSDEHAVPSKTHHILNTFVEAIKEDINEQLSKTKQIYTATWLKRNLKF